MTHPLRCETCNHFTDKKDCMQLSHWLLSTEYKFVEELGCASHSSAPVPEGYVITKEELYLLDKMTYIPPIVRPVLKEIRTRSCPQPSEQSIRQDEREEVLGEMCMICPFLDERPETCENCVVETVRKNLRQEGKEEEK